MNTHGSVSSPNGYRVAVNRAQNGMNSQRQENSIFAVPMTTGYVHSGYQSAIGNLYHSSPSFANLSPSKAAISQPRIRPPRLGPGGPVQCGNPGCPYSGYSRDVEIHRMDRHLIFPPGYKSEKGPPDGDLGPNMTIPGTGIRLNTQEAIDAWIAERKKNWPTDARIAEKKRRAAEAIESGEIERRHKRPRATEDPIIPFQTKRGKNTQRGGRYARRGRGGGRTTVDVLPPKPVTSHIAEPRTASPKREKRLDLSSNEDSSESGSGSDVDPIVDSISSKLPPKDWGQPSNEEDIAESELELPSNPKPLQRRKPREPTGRRLDPLIDRPSFLRRLLQHEIRTSVSNLSQAIRFIVANDMFAGVELRPGDADGALITEIGSTEATAGHETRT